MATRQEIQIAWDLIRFTNVANDLFDGIISIARSQKQKIKKVAVGSPPEFEIMTVDDIKTNVVRTMQNIQNYTDLILRFLGDSGKKASAINGLTAWGVNVNDIINDNQDMSSKAVQVSNNVAQASSRADFNAIADFIKTNIPNLNLVRKS